VNLGILIDQTAKVRSAGGFIIQQMPFADPKLADIINDNLAGTPNISDLMDMGYCLEDILSRFVFKGLIGRPATVSKSHTHAIAAEKGFPERCYCWEKMNWQV
jgi:redox-regulated HSP33 family molecular chaperone